MIRRRYACLGTALVVFWATMCLSIGAETPPKAEEKRLLQVAKSLVPVFEGESKVVDDRRFVSRRALTAETKSAILRDNQGDIQRAVDKLGVEGKSPAVDYLRTLLAFATVSNTQVSIRFGQPSRTTGVDDSLIRWTASYALLQTSGERFFLEVLDGAIKEKWGNVNEIAVIQSTMAIAFNQQYAIDTSSEGEAVLNTLLKLTEHGAPHRIRCVGVIALNAALGKMRDYVSGRATVPPEYIYTIVQSLRGLTVDPDTSNTLATEYSNLLAIPPRATIGEHRASSLELSPLASAGESLNSMWVKLGVTPKYVERIHTIHGLLDGLSTGQRRELCSVSNERASDGFLFALLAYGDLQQTNSALMGYLYGFGRSKLFQLMIEAPTESRRQVIIRAITFSILNDDPCDDNTARSELRSLLEQLIAGNAKTKVVAATAIHALRQKHSTLTDGSDQLFDTRLLGSFEAEGQKLGQLKDIENADDWREYYDFASGNVMPEVRGLNAMSAYGGLVATEGADYLAAVADWLFEHKTLLVLTLAYIGLSIIAALTLARIRPTVVKAVANNPDFLHQFVNLKTENGFISYFVSIGEALLFPFSRTCLAVAVRPKFQAKWLRIVFDKYSIPEQLEQCMQMRSQPTVLPIRIERRQGDNWQIIGQNNLTAHCGSWTNIVGDFGTGKSTVCAQIARLLFRGPGSAKGADTCVFPVFITDESPTRIDSEDDLVDYVAGEFSTYLGTENASSNFIRSLLKNGKIAVVVDGSAAVNRTASAFCKSLKVKTIVVVSATEMTFLGPWTVIRTLKLNNTEVEHFVESYWRMKRSESASILSPGKACDFPKLYDDETVPICCVVDYANNPGDQSKVWEGFVQYLLHRTDVAAKIHGQLFDALETIASQWFKEGYMQVTKAELLAWINNDPDGIIGYLEHMGIVKTLPDGRAELIYRTCGDYFAAKRFVEDYNLDQKSLDELRCLPSFARIQSLMAS
jgi:hypothetical protein